METCGAGNVPPATVVVVLAGGGTADGDCAGADAGAATLLEGAAGTACKDFGGSTGVGANDFVGSVDWVGAGVKSTALISHATAATAAVTPSPSIRPREEPVLDRETCDDEAAP